MDPIEMEQRDSEKSAATRQVLCCEALVIATQSRPVLHFVGEVDPWLKYRKGLISRFEAWHATEAASGTGCAALDHGEAETLFPPPVHSAALAAGSRWRPATNHEAKLVVVSVGGIFGGFDGPSGLFDYAATVLEADTAFLQLDTGHDMRVAVAVLRAGLQWLLTAEPQYSGRIILAGFSMGSATAVEVGLEFLQHIRGLVFVAGQTAGTQNLAQFLRKQVLIIHGEEDRNVSVECGYELARIAHSAEATVRLHILPQAAHAAGRAESGEQRRLEALRRHHLWDERWSMQELVLAWLRSVAALT